MTATDEVISHAEALEFSAVRGIEYELRTLVRRIRLNKAEVARTIHEEMPPSTYTVFVVVSDRQPTRAGEIAEVLDMDKSVISRHLAALTELGLIRRDCDPDDRRSHTVSLTGLGVEKVREAITMRWEDISARLEGWTMDDLEAFVAQLRRFNAAIE
ncbi:MarR family winged helix-turn-helix transcriptional regulator [Tomitella cavernea]|uniref:MarR family transcriptional regulator n=1 Tax=Tomitella cavernea TaxID=1387982 RepID=A0ABP9D0U1_9ACTN|nr:MarR family transcriptional regulator [Tomitella cavernea]